MEGEYREGRFLYQVIGIINIEIVSVYVFRCFYIDNVFARNSYQKCDSLCLKEPFE